ncbi:beta-ketoacyl-ACP synthase [Candidatus Magnetaquicoccus inordinatus]|uniref:beta-ketoacyl-ACP synthase n=1 Tax=Candidatus Magnetaquicoccus inordinatus TaxID=2496818 RepID=UPI00102B3A0A|nr:beta-ketoacyl-ACP synthase [Candidatus Magnetaquicoccus inordinatus]
MNRRVAVVGMAGLTPLGHDWPTIRAHMDAGNNGIRTMHDWDRYTSINTRLAAPLAENWGDKFDRKKCRTMGPVARMAVRATEKALKQANLLEDPILNSGRCGIAFGSSFGSPGPVTAFAELMTTGSSRTLNATSYIQMMSHTAAVNIGIFFGINGRIITTSSACTSGSQAIGYAAEAIRFGKAEVMVAGGADELDVTEAAVFDTLYATSVRNDQPHHNPRPFDRDRDGLVIGEGAAALILEEWNRAETRGATIFAEIVGFATNADGNHITQPQLRTVEEVMRLALQDAQLQPEVIDCINGHGTATEFGDIVESQATSHIFADRVPFHALKGYFGHTLGACGAIEAWLGIEMMREGWFCPNLNLDHVDSRCAGLDYIIGQARNFSVNHLMSNNFAFGGINTSLIIKNPSSS